MFNIKIVRNRIFMDSIGGELYVNGQFLCYTLELPWLWNENYKSCVPNGTYHAFIRDNGHLGWRIQLQGVEGRTLVEIHIGNWPRDSVGCILVGTSYAAGYVLHSKSARARLKAAYEQQSRPVQVVIEGAMATPAGDYPNATGRSVVA